MLSDVPVWHGVFDPPAGALLVMPRSAVLHADWPWILRHGTRPTNTQPWCYASLLAVVLQRTQPLPSMVVFCAVHEWSADMVQHARRTVAMAAGTTTTIGIQGDLAALGHGDSACTHALQAISSVPRSPTTPNIVPANSHHVATLEEAWAWCAAAHPIDSDHAVVVVTLEPELAVQHHAKGLGDLRKPGRWVFVGPNNDPRHVVEPKTREDVPPGFLLCEKPCRVTPTVVPRCDAAQATYVTPAQFRRHFGWVHRAILLVDVPLALQCRVAARCRNGVCTVRCRKLSNDRVPFAFSATASTTQPQGP